MYYTKKEYYNERVLARYSYCLFSFGSNTSRAILEREGGNNIKIRMSKLHTHIKIKI